MTKINNQTCFRRIQKKAGQISNFYSFFEVGWSCEATDIVMGVGTQSGTQNSRNPQNCFREKKAMVFNPGE